MNNIVKVNNVAIDLNDLDYDNLVEFVQGKTHTLVDNNFLRIQPLRTRQEVEIMIDKALTWVVSETTQEPNMTYEKGVYIALMWVNKDFKDKPIKDESKES